MTRVVCDYSEYCRYGKDGVCTLPEVHLFVYDGFLLCENWEDRPVLVKLEDIK
jgi:hypothetical protein